MSDMADGRFDERLARDSLRRLKISAVFLAATFSLASYVVTGNYNPLKVFESLDRYIRIEQDYLRKYELVLDKNGLADRNHDGRISFSERDEAWDRMGLDYRIENPTVRDLEKAIQSYRSRK